MGALPSYFLAEERASNLDPCRWAQDRNIPFTLHFDSPVVPQNPLQTIWTAVNRNTASGNLLGAKEQRITPLDALRACTYNAARKNFFRKPNRLSRTRKIS